MRTGHDFRLVKLDSVGDLSWDARTGGQNVLEGVSIAHARNGGFVAVGLGAPGDRHYDTGDIYIIKTDSVGRLQWKRLHGGPHLDDAAWVDSTRDGGFIIAGKTFSGTPGNCDGYVVKVGSEGGLEWELTFGVATWPSRADCVQQTADGGYIIAGYESDVADASRDYFYLQKLAPAAK